MTCYSRVLNHYNHVIDLHTASLTCYTAVMTCYRRVLNRYSHVIDLHTASLTCYTAVMTCYSHVLNRYSRVIDLHTASLTYCTASMSGYNQTMNLIMYHLHVTIQHSTITVKRLIVKQSRRTPINTALKKPPRKEVAYMVQSLIFNYLPGLRSLLFLAL